MATPPDFSVGGVLTAAQMDQIGLWICPPTSATGGTVTGNHVVIGSGVTSVTVNGVFSASFTNYMIRVAGVKAGAQVGTSLQLSGITTGYDTQGFYMLKGSSAITGFNVSGASGWDCGATDTGASLHEVHLVNPNVASPKAMFARATGQGGVNIGVQTFGENASTSTATGFVYSVGASSLTGGTITVYGYNS